MSSVYLSPSPAQFNVGYGDFGTEEMRMNLIADTVQLILVENGITVDRNDPDYGLVEVVADANAKNSEVYVSIRSEEADTVTRGVSVYFYREGTNGERLALDIYESLFPILPTENNKVLNGRSVYGGLGYYELYRTLMPSVIVFVGYHDNPDDARFIVDNTENIGRAIAIGILRYFGKDTELIPPAP